MNSNYFWVVYFVNSVFLLDFSRSRRIQDLSLNFRHATFPFTENFTGWPRKAKEPHSSVFS